MVELKKLSRLEIQDLLNESIEEISNKWRRYRSFRALSDSEILKSMTYCELFNYLGDGFFVLNSYGHYNNVCCEEERLRIFIKNNTKDDDRHRSCGENQLIDSKIKIFIKASFYAYSDYFKLYGDLLMYNRIIF